MIERYIENSTGKMLTAIYWDGTDETIDEIIKEFGVSVEKIDDRLELKGRNPIPEYVYPHCYILEYNNKLKVCSYNFFNKKFIIGFEPVIVGFEHSISHIYYMVADLYKSSEKMRTIVMESTFKKEIESIDELNEVSNKIKEKFKCDEAIIVFYKLLRVEKQLY